MEFYLFKKSLSSFFPLVLFGLFHTPSLPQAIHGIVLLLPFQNDVFFLLEMNLY